MAYTVGCAHTLQQPELVVVGLPPYMGLAVLDRLAEGWRSGGQWPVDEPVSGILETHPVRLVSVSPTGAQERLRVANVLGAEDYRVLQVLWPDPAGRFPDDPLCEERTRLRQPLLTAAA